MSVSSLTQVNGLYCAGKSPVFRTAFCASVFHAKWLFFVEIHRSFESNSNLCASYNVLHAIWLTFLHGSLSLEAKL